MFAGIDFGTSNSSIGVFQSGKLQLFDLDLRHQNPHVLPSFIYISKEQKVEVGLEAIETYLEKETGRHPIWEKRYLGDMQITVSGGKNPIVYMHDIMVDVDVAANGRLMQSIKTALQNPDYKGTEVFDHFYQIEDLIAILLKALREKSESSLQQDVEHVVIGRPVKFSDDPEVDALAQDKLLASAQLAGFKDITFELEPIGGAYLYHQTQPTRQKIFVFDFGGGTLDMTIMEVGGNQPPETLATHGVLLGGDDLTAALMQPLLKLFGMGATLRDGLPVPAYIFERLHNWKNLVELSKPEYTSIFKEGKLGNDPIGIERLEKLVKEKQGFKLFQELEQIKIDLSSEYYKKLVFFEDSLKINELILRSRFEDLIQVEMYEIHKSINELLKKSGVSAEKIDAVLRTGGSSEIPVVIECLASWFGHERIKEINPFTTIVGGLALKANELSLN